MAIKAVSKFNLEIPFLSLENFEENFYIFAVFLFYFYINAISLTKDFVFTICYKTSFWARKVNVDIFPPTSERRSSTTLL